MKIHLYEKAFLSVGGLMLVVFLGGLAFATMGAGIHLPDRAGMVDPKRYGRRRPSTTRGCARSHPAGTRWW